MDSASSVGTRPPVDAPVNPAGVTSLNLNASSNAVEDAEIAEQTRRSQSGANWFFWIAGLSLINSVILLSNGQWSFLAGLGITQIIDVLARTLAAKLGNGAIAFALFLDLAAAGVVVLFGLMARRRHTWAFVLGMILYGLDGLLFLLLKDWLSLAFHAYAFYCIYRGLSATNRLNELLPATERVPA